MSHKNKEEQSKQITPVVTNSHHPENNWDKPFWRSVTSSEYGTGSTSRVTTLAIIVVTLGVLVYLVWRNDGIPAKLMDLGLFSALLITAVYSPAKIAGIFKSFFTKK